MNRQDMNVLEFARKISMLSTDTPLATNYDNTCGQKTNRWWHCQQEHLTVWCLHYPTNGVKGFEHVPSDSASQMYNRFGRPETLLWLIEALILEKYKKEKEEQLAELERLINELYETKPRAACAIIRKKVPFEKIYNLLEDSAGGEIW